MLISNVVAGVVTDLNALGELGDDQVRRTLALVSTALEPSLRQRVTEALNEAVAELNAAAGTTRVEIRLAGDDVSLVWRDVEAAAPEPPSDLNARVALRLPDDAKSRIEQRATTEGLSVNAWIVRSLQIALERSSAAAASRGGRTMRGTGKS